ncbi:MAG: hypothetical protein ABI443_03335 [Chthoniobacterales bacterium]
MSAHPSPSDTPKSLWPIFLIGLVMLSLFFFASQWFIHSNPKPDEEAERATLRAKNLEDLNKDNAQKLNNYSWADKSKGIVRVPIARAIELTIPVLSQSKPHAAYPISTPAPVAAPAAAAPAASPAPATPAHPAASPAAAQPSPKHS